MHRQIRDKSKYYVCVILVAYLITSLTYNFFDKAAILRQTKNELKYILQWTSPNTSPFMYMDVGRNVFIDHNCSYSNCYVTSDQNFFVNYTSFDAILFAGPEIIYFWKSMLPEARSPQQKYVYANIESSDYYPVCTNKFDDYFNWTWTYKLDSDLRWGYIVVKNMEGEVVGPKIDMHWIKQKDMAPVNEGLKTVLRGKTKAAAWFVSNCNTVSDRERFAAKLRKKLKSKYNLKLDVYGKCTNLECSDEDYCDEMIRNHYYFYLAFENAFSEDYVTEKLLHAVKYNAIPVVYGGANYTRFLPEGSYLNAEELGVKKLAAKMNRLINNFDEYVEYFRWTNHYTYHKKSESPETDDYCQMCALLNDDHKMNTESSYKDFKKWWNMPNADCYDNIINYQLREK